MLSDFVKYVKQYWHDRPDKSTPLNADRLNHIENGIASNSEAINQIANAVVSNIVNDPEQIASMAAVYALQEKLGTGELPSDAPNAISAINTLYSNFLTVEYNSIITISTLKTWTESSYEITSPPVGFSFNDIVSITAFSQKDHWEKWLRLVVNQQAAGRGTLAIIGYGINKTGQIPITIRVCYKK